MYAIHYCRYAVVHLVQFISLKDVINGNREPFLSEVTALTTPDHRFDSHLDRPIISKIDYTITLKLSKYV